MELATAHTWEPAQLDPKSQRVEPAPVHGPELTIVVPTFNERGNVAELVSRLRACLPDAAWEVVFVDDDSPDGTADAVRALASEDSRVRCIQRIGRRGLSSACVEGMLSSSAAYLAVIDGDLQHDERLLPRMLAALKAEDTDIVVGSRYAAGGDIGSWDAGRARLSRLATRISRALVPAQLTDPMSGFFMMRRAVFTDAQRRLSSLGFKILTDLFASHPEPLRFKEMSYSFGTRHAGESKFDSASAWDYLMLVLDKLLGHLVPVRFLAFSIVGTLGVVVHFTVLASLFRVLRLGFLESRPHASATLNFSVNNLLTTATGACRARWVRGSSPSCWPAASAR
jgi:dolichol-phosphate mannosyltransferase